MKDSVPPNDVAQGYDDWDLQEVRSLLVGIPDLEQDQDLSWKARYRAACGLVVFALRMIDEMLGDEQR